MSTIRSEFLKGFMIGAVLACWVSVLVIAAAQHVH